MSHTTEWEGPCYPQQRPKTPGPQKGRREAKVSMHHSGDPDGGNVRFFLSNWIADVSVHHGAGPNEEGMAEVHIPFDAIKELVLDYYRNKVIEMIKQAEGAELEALISPVVHKEMLAAYKPSTPEFLSKKDPLVMPIEPKLPKQADSGGLGPETL